MARRPGFGSGVILLVSAALAAVWAPAALAAGKDTVALKTGKRMSEVTVTKDGHEGIEVDRDGDGIADETLAPDKVAEVIYGDAPQLYLLALASIKNAQYAKAVEELGKALQEKKVRGFWLKQHGNYLMGECYRRMAGADKALLAKARAAYERVLAETAQGRMAPAAVLGVGLCHLREGNLNDARRRFEKLEMAGEYGDVWVQRGKLALAEVHSRNGDHDDALSLCAEVAKTAKLAEILGQAARARGRLLARAGRLDPALKVFSDIARKSPDKDIDAKAAAYNGIGDVLAAKNRVREALLAYLRVRVLYFKSRDELPHALYGAARCFRILKRAKEARELVAELEKAYPKSAWTAKAKKELRG